MESHENDLRSVVEGDGQRRAVQEDYRSAGLTPREVALLDFAVKLTRSPGAVRRDDLDALRGHGFADDQLVDAVHCIGYFNLINRVLDGLGVDPEPSMRYGTAQPPRPADSGRSPDRPGALPAGGPGR
jgi:uncharacterized peroxidase-related enzyme